MFDEENRNKYLKCRVDKEKEVNMVVQTSFDLDYSMTIYKIMQCSKLFHSNPYPIIIIESFNGGGYVKFAFAMHQFLQLRTVDKGYISYRMSDKAKELNKGHFKLLPE